VHRAVVLWLAFALHFAAQAQLVVLSAGGGSGGGGGGGVYGLEEALADYPGTITPPTAPTLPTITSTADVDNSTLTANKVNGRQVTISGDVGDETFSTTDQRIILAAGAEIGALTISGQRIEVYCADLSDCNIANVTLTSAASDIFFHECTIGNVGVDDDNFFNGADRVAVIGCDVSMGSYGFYSDNGCNDLIFANNFIHSTGTSPGGADPTMRFMSCNRTLTRDNCISNASAAQNHRIHANTGEGDSANHWIKNNQVNGSMGSYQPDSTGGGSTASLSDILVEDNEFYPGGASANWGDGGSAGQRAQDMTWRNNNLYSTGGVFYPELEATWDIDASNVVHATASAPACTKAVLQ
jgi:hypothetical protein